jgi:hypothetical protein
MSADSSFWVKEDGYNTIYLTSVVGDMLVTSDDPALTKSVLKQFQKPFLGLPVEGPITTMVLRSLGLMMNTL